MKVYYNSEPTKLEATGNGSYRYRWNIKEVNVEIGETPQQLQTQWECDEVTVWSPITPNRITAAVIREKWPADYEQKLINEYNCVQLGILSLEDEIDKVKRYKSFLEERAALKKEIDEYCAEHGIL